MANFILIGGTPVPIQHSKARRKQSIQIGESTRAAAGNFVSTVSGEKRIWEFTSGPLTGDEEQFLRDVCALDIEIGVSGDAIGSLVTCIVHITESEFISDGTVDGFLLLMTFTVEEV